MKKTVILLTSFLLMVMLVASSLNRPSVLAQPTNQQDDAGSSRRIIQVSGSGTASAQPDNALIVVGVRTEAEAASDALAQNSQQANALIAALRQAGVAQDDIQTQQINLSPRYSDQPDQAGQSQVTGYIATNTVQVRIRNIADVGQILDTAVASGGNLIESISFEVSDQEAVLQQARASAFDNARQKAEQLADLAGVELGQLVSITETSGSIPRPFAAGRDVAAEQAAVPVSPGTQNVQVDLQVAWEITGGGGTVTRTLTPIIPPTGTTETSTPTLINPTRTSSPTAFATSTPTPFSSSATPAASSATPSTGDTAKRTPSATSTAAGP